MCPQSRVPLYYFCQFFFKLVQGLCIARELWHVPLPLLAQGVLLAAAAAASTSSSSSSSSHLQLCQLFSFISYLTNIIPCLLQSCFLLSPLFQFGLLLSTWLLDLLSLNFFCSFDESISELALLFYRVWCKYLLSSFIHIGAISRQCWLLCWQIRAIKSWLLEFLFGGIII